MSSSRADEFLRSLGMGMGGDRRSRNVPEVAADGSLTEVDDSTRAADGSGPGWDVPAAGWTIHTRDADGSADGWDRP